MGRVGGWLSLVVAIEVVAGTFCGPAFAAAKEPDPVVKGNTEFALDLYGKLKEQEGNLFFSPYSISTALAMTCAGARGNTETQMGKVLHLPTTMIRVHMTNENGLEREVEREVPLSPERVAAAFGRLVDEMNAAGKKKGYQLNIANSLWAQQDCKFLKPFTDLVTTSYEAGLNKVDFKTAAEDARKTINKWVEEKTKDKIKDLLQPRMITEMTRLVLVNAIYFKGEWHYKFDKKMTREGEFTLKDKKTIQVPMMERGALLRYMKGDGFEALVFPYAGDELSMVAFLPKEANGLTEFEKTLTPKNLAGWLGKLQWEKVVVTLPKFTMTQAFELSKTLSAMGMTDAFRPEADFSGMTGSKDLFVSSVVHKAFVDVNEEGTEAAAATAVVAPAAEGSVARYVIFCVDRPFLFIIRHNATGSILFVGRVVDPRG